MYLEIHDVMRIKFKSDIFSKVAATEATRMLAFARV